MKKKYADQFSYANLESCFDKKVVKVKSKGIDKKSATNFKRDKEKELKIIERKIQAGTYKFSPYLELLQNSVATIDNSNQERIEIIKLAEFALRATCQLYQTKNGNSNFPIANGCAVLFEYNSNHYCFSNAHVLADKQLGKTFFLSNNSAVTIGGQIFYTRLPSSNRREDDTFDIALVKLKSDVVEYLKQGGYHFLKLDQILTGLKLLNNEVLLITGYPASKTKIDFRTNRLKFNPLIARTIPFSKDLKNENFLKDFHHIVEYPISSFKETSTAERMRAPKPHGLSGSGLWLLAKNSPSHVQLFLIGILSEYHENRAILVSTKIDLFIDLIRQKFDSTIQNDGIKIELVE